MAARGNNGVFRRAAESLIPRPSASAEWVWAWARLPIAVFIAVIGLNSLDAPSLRPFIWTVLGGMVAYDLAAFVLLRLGKLNVAFWTGVAVDIIVLALIWWQTLSAPEGGVTPTEVQLVLLPSTLGMAVRLGFGFGALYFLGVVGIVLYMRAFQAFELPDLEVSITRFSNLVAVIVLAGAFSRIMKNQATEIHSQRSQYIGLIEQIPDGVVLISGGRRVYANQAFVEMFGYADLDTTLSPPCGDRVAGDDMPTLQRVLAHPTEPFRINVRIEHPTRGLRDAEAVGSPIVYDGGRVLLVVMRDATERRAEQAALEESEERFRTLFESSPVGMTLSSSDARSIAQANPAMGKILGVAREEIVGKRLSDFRYPGYVPESDATGDSIRSGDEEDVAYDRELVRADGKKVIVDITATAAKTSDGRLLNILRTVVDRTRERSDAEALRRSEDQFRRLFESAPLGIIISGPDRKIDQVNERLCEMLGYPREQLVGRRISDFEVDRIGRGTTGQYEAVVAGELESYQISRELVRRNGEHFWANTTTAAVRDDNGGFLSTIRIIADVSGFIRLDQAKDQFIASTGHELRTPLTAIHAVLGLAVAGHLGEIPESLKTQLRLAESNSRRLLDLVEDVLTVEQMKLGGFDLSIETVDLWWLIHEAVDALSPLAPQGTTLEIDAEPVMVECDRRRIEQVITNLVSNAFKYAPEGSSIVVSSRRQDDSVVVSVADNGLGIPEDLLEKVFDPFERAVREEQATAAGAGLGLAIARGIVEQHGGSVDASNREDGGAVFTFTLPVRQSS